MNKKTFLIVIILSLVMTGCSISESKVQEYEDTIAELSNEIEYLNSEIKILKENLNSCEIQRDEYKEYYDNNCDLDTFVPEFKDY